MYSLADRYAGQFDLVYITVGVLGWMPTLPGFFAVVQDLLRPGGRVFIYEQHPILNMYNPAPPHALDSSYFQKTPFRDEILPEYIDEAGTGRAVSYWFPHTLGDVLNAYLGNGLTLTHFQEYATEVSDTYKALENVTAQLPLSFTLLAGK